jgi:hypothetical protein
MGDINKWGEIDLERFIEHFKSRQYYILDDFQIKPLHKKIRICIIDNSNYNNLNIDEFTKIIKKEIEK